MVWENAESATQDKLLNSFIVGGFLWTMNPGRESRQGSSGNFIGFLIDCHQLQVYQIHSLSQSPVFLTVCGTQPSVVG